MVAAVQRLGARLAQYPWVWWGWLLIWAAVLFALSEDSSPDTGPDFPLKDKVLHCLYFSGGAFCFLLGLWGKMGLVRSLRFAVVGMLFTAVAGALDELHQTFTPGRSGNDPLDWLADLSGGLLGGMLALLFLQWVRRAVPAGRE